MGSRDGAEGCRSGNSCGGWIGGSNLSIAKLLVHLLHPALQDGFDLLGGLGSDVELLKAADGALTVGGTFRHRQRLSYLSLR